MNYLSFHKSTDLSNDKFGHCISQNMNKIHFPQSCAYVNLYVQSHFLESCLVGTGIAQSVEALHFTTELHPSSVRVRVGKNPSECMWFGCRLPVAVVSQAYPGNAVICPGFPPPQAALRIILSNR